MNCRAIYEQNKVVKNRVIDWKLTRIVLYPWEILSIKRNWPFWSKYHLANNEFEAIFIAIVSRIFNDLLRKDVFI